MTQTLSEMSGEPVRTALYEQHVELDANIVDFHGFELPIWYTSISDEHIATRTTAGLFDVSHMGLFRFSGPGVMSWLESIATQSVTSIPVGRCAYTHFLDEKGHIIDDMIFAVTDSDEIDSTGQKPVNANAESVILGVPNASMVSVMFDHFNSQLPSEGEIIFEDLSDETSIIALQGPSSPQIVAETIGEENAVGRFRCQAIRPNNLGIRGWVQGTGYTGERGYEIFVSNSDAPLLWRSLLEAGGSHGLVPVGLGARDTLRLEKGYLLSGQDFLWPEIGDCDDDLPSGFLARNTWETNVPFGLDMGHEFLGKRFVEESRNSEAERWWGLKYLGKGPLPRPGIAFNRFSNWPVVLIGYLERDCTIDLAMDLAFGSSPKANKIRINSSSEAELIKFAAVIDDPLRSKRMSNGSSR